MASDEDYMAFLDKANEDLRAGQAAASAAAQAAQAAKVSLKTSDRGVAVPPELVAAVTAGGGDAVVYVSDADEPFVPVALRFAGKTLPDEETFAELVGLPVAAAAGIEILDVALWDSAGRYRQLVGAVRDASEGADVRVYRVPIDGTRVQYFLVGVDGEAGLLVGFNALAIES